MRIELKTKHYVSMAAGALILILDFALFFKFTDGFGPKEWYFNPIILISFLIGSSTFIIDFFEENRRQKEIEEKFLEFVRSLVESVRSGVNVPKGILHVAGSDYGALTPYVRKLAHQIEWGYPLHDALHIFAADTKNPVIKRSVAIVTQAEKSGGDIGSVLESVTTSVLEIKKVKDERKSNAYAQMIQGYIIFFVFVAIMVVLQVYLMPKLSAIGSEVWQGLGTVGIGGVIGSGQKMDIGKIFIATIAVQGLFAGMMIGKFAEGDYKSGLKHSLIMIVLGYLIMATVAGLVESGTTAAVTGTGAQALALLISKNWVFKSKKLKKEVKVEQVNYCKFS